MSGKGLEQPRPANATAFWGSRATAASNAAKASSRLFAPAAPGRAHVALGRARARSEGDDGDQDQDRDRGSRTHDLETHPGRARYSASCAPGRFQLSHPCDITSDKVSYVCNAELWTRLGRSRLVGLVARQPGPVGFGAHGVL